MLSLLYMTQGDNVDEWTNVDLSGEEIEED